MEKAGGRQFGRADDEWGATQKKRFFSSLRKLLH